jgi:hypothetical protein
MNLMIDLVLIFLKYLHFVDDMMFCNVQCSLLIVFLMSIILVYVLLYPASQYADVGHVSFVNVCVLKKC